MASVQELLALAEANNRQRTPASSAVENLLAGVQQAQNQSLQRAQMLIQLDEQRKQRERMAEEDRQARAMLEKQYQDSLHQGLNGVASGKPLTRSQKVEVTVSPNASGLMKRDFKIVDTGSADNELKNLLLESRIALNEKKLAEGPKDDDYTKALKKEQAKKEINRPKEAKLLSNAEANFDRMIAEAEAIKNDPALDGAVGFVKTSFVPGTSAYKIRKRIDTLKSKTGFSVLQEMRASSPTGGALGQVSDRENQMLQENIATLDTGQNINDFKGALDRIIDYARSGKQRLRGAFDEYYGEGTSATPKSGMGSSKKTAEARFSELISSGKSEDDAYRILAQEGY